MPTLGERLRSIRDRLLEIVGLKKKQPEEVLQTLDTPNTEENVKEDIEQLDQLEIQEQQTLSTALYYEYIVVFAVDYKAKNKANVTIDIQILLGSRTSLSPSQIRQQALALLSNKTKKIMNNITRNIQFAYDISVKQGKPENRILRKRIESKYNSKTYNLDLK